MPKFLGRGESKSKLDIFVIRLSLKFSGSESRSISGFWSLRTGSGWSPSKSEDRTELGVSWDRKDSDPVSIFSSEDGDVNSSSFERCVLKLLEQNREL